jgi:hypothetical protein
MWVFSDEPTVILLDPMSTRCMLAARAYDRPAVQPGSVQPELVKKKVDMSDTCQAIQHSILLFHMDETTKNGV